MFRPVSTPCRPVREYIFGIHFFNSPNNICTLAIMTPYVEITCCTENIFRKKLFLIRFLSLLLFFRELYVKPVSVTTQKTEN